ncbi:hypothetical protein DEU56DRAFT_873841 [Suillus clintonianus]|uniref:uncharacterized protein n=1 Tax=Suillus clintonianus TaxID=1904413 RepID=UPI001B86E6E9|nr:uncharacterized protein DEU56DRAFT_873841 [Suillus clintonianus]KAG2121119.1 hypothetical protein DEU56DRAFT_873841 [Suillus clintonianus]
MTDHSRRTNQHKPCPPAREIQEPARFYFTLNMSDVDIVRHLKDHYDQEEYGLSVVSFRRMRNSWGWKRTRQQQHTLESIEQHVREIRQRFPHRGAEAIRRDLRQQFSFHVPRELIAKLLKITEPTAVKARRRGRLKRRRFWCAGVNDVWPQDQHDKWLRFGLWLHISLDPFTGWINWLKIWWTNKNPRLIARYYLDCCRKLGAVPLITQSDPGSENFAVANAQTMIRHRLDPALNGTLQHRWMRKHQNIKPEIMWSVLRRDFAPGFENILDEGVTRGLYDINNTLQNYVFRWLAIPWLQAELDAWAHRRNHNAPRRDKNKILPHGIPAIIRSKPHEFNSLDFKVAVPSALFDEVEAIYAPPNHPVFDLVPPLFEQRAQYLYTSLGKPQVSSDSFWNVYQMLLAQFLAIEGEDDLTVLLSQGIVEPEDEDDLPQNAGLVGPVGYQYMGGMVNPPTQALHGVQDWGSQGEDQVDEDQPEVAEFTDSDSESDS